MPRRGSRVSGPGSHGTGRLLAAGTALVLAVLAGWLLSRPDGPTPRAVQSASRYGGLPTWLPKSAIPVGRTVKASAAHPWLAVEGDTVSVSLTHGHVLATAVGPAVPEEGQFPVPATTRCTFTITFARPSGTVPLRPSAFTIVDELGHLHHPQVKRHGGDSAPTGLSSGRTVTLTVISRLPTGSGQLRWAPQGTRPIVSWDFDVEID